MRWKPYKLKDGSHAQATIASDAGYAICRCTVGSAMQVRYIAFKGFSGQPNFKVLGGYDTAEEAKAICECHFAQSQEAVA